MLFYNYLLFSYINYHNFENNFVLILFTILPVCPEMSRFTATVHNPKIDVAHAILAAAHASLSGYLTFMGNELFGIKRDKNYVMGNTPTMDWVNNSFRKVICKVSPEEFERVKKYGTNMIDYRVITESKFDNMEIAIVIAPRDTSEDNSFNRFLKSLKLYK